MSGPLASWVAEHSKASWKGRAVLNQYALAAHPDGTPAADVTREDLERRTGIPRSSIARGRREAEGLGELELLAAGGGRGRASCYRVVVTVCDPGSRCWTCDLLRSHLQKGVHPEPVSAPAKHRKGSRRAQKGSRVTRKGSTVDPTTETEERHPSQGGAVPHPESNDRAPLRSAASGSAARSAAQEPARNDDGKVPVDWRAALGKVVPDTGERFESREEEEREKRRRAELLVLVPGRSPPGEPADDPPCRDCPEGAAAG